MSAGRRARRRVERSRIATAVAESIDGPAVFVGMHDATHEVWRVGSLTSVVPIVPVDGTFEEREAARVRRAVALTGACPECQAKRRIVRKHDQFRLVVKHADDCSERGVWLEEVVRPRRRPS